MTSKVVVVDGAGSFVEGGGRAEYVLRGIYKAPLPCSLNGTIRVDRGLANRLGVHWYERQRVSGSGKSESCQGLSEVSHKMEPNCDAGAGNSGVRVSQRQVLVVAVQRSGTHYTWEMFNR